MSDPRTLLTWLRDDLARIQPDAEFVILEGSRLVRRTAAGDELLYLLTLDGQIVNVARVAPDARVILVAWRTEGGQIVTRPATATYDGETFTLRVGGETLTPADLPGACLIIPVVVVADAARRAGWIVTDSILSRAIRPW